MWERWQWNPSFLLEKGRASSTGSFHSLYFTCLGYFIQFFGERLMVYFIHHRQQYHRGTVYISNNSIFSNFWWDKFFISIILNYFRIMHQSNSCIEHLFFSFPSDFFIYQLHFSVFWPIWEFSIAFYWKILFPTRQMHNIIFAGL